MPDLKTPYVDAVSTSLPSVLSDLLLSFDVFSREKLETLVRFCVDAACPPRIAGHSDAWKSGQTRLKARLAHIGSTADGKRAREGDDDGNGEAPYTNGHENGNGSSVPNKKQKLSAAEDEPGDTTPLYTLHALSVSAPVRKKVDVAITADAIRLTHPSSGALEARVPLAVLTRAFLVSSLGKNKNKPQWAVTIISADSVDKKGDAAAQVQFTFNLDQSVPAGKDGFKTTVGGASKPVSHEKGAATLPILQAFLACLPDRIELHTALGPEKGAPPPPFVSTSGQPFVDAYLGAKEGALCFLERGILWATARPCEFFALEDLAPDSDVPGLGGVKTLSATGRTFSVFLRRRGKPAGGEGDSSAEEDSEEEEEGAETEFAMIDGRESENVNSWIRKYRRTFGKPRTGSEAASVASADVKGKGRARAESVEVQQNGGNSDESDEDFEEPSDSDGGEPSSDSEGSEGGGSGQRDDEDEEEASDSDDSGGVEEEEELDPARHPLMRPGAMPRMSKAAMDAAVAMVMGDVAGSADEEEEDELE
ncbi:hypothetical protein M0805_008063 [Coniferiporia weirii]|nr:hypothetical protein M0805_008063 [Coniferiporia weirii]